MKINGFQKMTLLDYPGKVACTIFTGGCNFRCPFCHNALLVTEIDPTTLIDENYIIDFLKKRVGLLDGVCITGGEPLLQDGIEDFIKTIKDLGFSVKLDTNGSFPDKLKFLVNNNLVDYVAMDIKNSLEKYPLTVDIKNYDTKKIKTSIEFLMQNKIPFEFRTTVVKEFHNVNDIENIAKVINGTKNYYLQNFEDRGNLIGENLHSVSKETLLKMKESASKFIQNVEIRGV